MQLQMRNRVGAILVATTACSVAAPVSAEDDDQPLPTPHVKPADWTSSIATHTGPAIDDDDFAEWVQQAQEKALRLLVDSRPRIDPRVLFMFTFNQCYSGGFVDELSRTRVPLLDFTASSAAQYFQCSWGRIGAFDHWARAWNAAVEHHEEEGDAILAKKAYNALRTGRGLPGVEKFERVVNGTMQPQYALNVDDFRAGQKIAAGDDNFAIIFAGRPDPRHANDVGDLMRTLTGLGYEAPDILVLYGDGRRPPGVTWHVNGPATHDAVKNASRRTTGGCSAPSVTAPAGRTCRCTCG